MTALALWHRLYTNAAADPRWETTGARIVPLERDAAAVLPAEALQDLDDLLKKTAPWGEGTGYVLRRYAAGSDAFVCLIASYGGLVSDTGGRAGRLNHARVVKVPAEQPHVDVAALVRAAEDFALDDVARAPAAERLAAYLEQVAAEQTVDVRNLTLDDLRELPRTFLCNVLAACQPVQGRREGVRVLLPPPEGQTLASAVAAAWAAAPAKLQRSASWAVDVDAGCPADAVLSAVKGQTIAPQAAARAARYVNELMDGPGSGQQVRTMDMKKGRSDPAPDAAELDRQYQAMEQRLKAYVDQRLEAFEAPTPSRVVVPAGRPMQPKLLLIAAVLVALALAAGSWWYLRGRKTSEVAQQADVPAQQAIDVPAADEPKPVFGGPSAAELRREALKTAIAAGSADGKWAQSFKNLLEKNGAAVSAALRDAADGANVDARAVTPEARDLLLELAANIDAKQPLTKDDRDNIRELLLDYVSTLAGGGTSVDGNLRDVTVKRLKERYQVVTRSDERKDADLQSEIILRWLETAAR